MNHLLPIAQALGWTVVHSFWQIALIWLVFKIFTWRLQRLNNTIYLLSLTAMFGAAVWSVCTFAAEYRRLVSYATNNPVMDSPAEESMVSAVGLALHTPDSSVKDMLAGIAGWFEHHAAEVGWAWCFCVSILYLRLLGGYWLAHRLRQRGVTAPAGSFADLAEAWAKTLNIRQSVGFFESNHVNEPLTIGFWKPVILFPVGLLAQLTPTQVEVLLLHELAHIRRHDYLVNLIQLVLEVFFFYHPLFWLLSREARSRREYCCDDMVVRHTSNPLLYAQTLTDLQLSLVHNQNQFTMNATGKSNFTERILRIAGITPKRSLRSNWFILLLLPLCLSLFSWWPAEAGIEHPKTPELVSANPGAPANTLFSPADTVRPQAAKPADGKANPAPPGSADAAEPAVNANVAIQAVKMNVFYIGLDNPLRIAAAGVPAGELIVRFTGPGELTGSNGNYIVRPTQPGGSSIRVFRAQNGKETLLSEQKYRVKRIPDPAPSMSGKKSQAISKNLLINAKGISAMLENFDFDAYCEIVGFELTVLPNKAEPVSISIKGGSFPDNALELFNSMGENGGAVFMDDIKVTCPGDTAPRNIGGLAYKIISDLKAKE